MTSWFGRERADDTKSRGPVLVIDGLDVFYGRAHALQGVSLTLERGVLGIVGRNGMGKTTLCNAITGLVPARGSVKLLGEEILGRAPNEITKRGIAYVPQGRRVWPSLSVDETLRLVAPKRRDVERVYTMFPRLAERRGHGGAQLSGGEQQMLAIGRALLLNPKLLVMDEPTEGLAPMIVEQVAQALRELAADGEIAVLLIEQNLGVAISVADRIGVMVNGRIAQQMPTAQLAGDRELQERLLGVRSAGADDTLEQSTPAPGAGEPSTVQVLTVRRAHGEGAPTLEDVAPNTVRGFTRWNAGGTAATVNDIARTVPPSPSPSPQPSPASGRGRGSGGEVFDFSIEVPVAIRDPDKRIGTHVFTAMARNEAGLRWTAVTIDHAAEAKAALDRITIPKDILDRIAPTAMPRSSIIISDEPLSKETNYRTEFVAVLSDQPQGGFITRKPATEIIARGDDGASFFQRGWDYQTGNTRRRGDYYRAPPWFR